MVLSNRGTEEPFTNGDDSVGEVGDEAPAPLPVARLACDVDMAAKAGAGSLPAPLPMRRHGKISCCVLCRSKCQRRMQRSVTCFVHMHSMIARLKSPLDVTGAYDT